MSFSANTQEAMRVFLENMVGEGLLAKEIGMSVTPRQVVDASLLQILKIAEESIPLSRIMDNSDLVLHAEGPGASHDLPWLSALNWLTDTAEKNLRSLSSAFFDLSGVDGKALSKKLDLRMTGMAPGSLWIGVKLMPPRGDLLPEDLALSELLQQTANNLPQIARYIDDEGLRSGIEEASPDPAMRDVSLSALLKFSPTGRKGIHTLDLSSLAHGSVSLSQRERVVLRDVLDRPDMKMTKDGSFIGEVREADLDKTRFHLNGVPNIGTLRCILPEMHVDMARNMLGRRVKVTGRYQTDRDGRPRLLMAENVEAMPETGSLI